MPPAPHIVIAEPLTPEEFAPFGEVLGMSHGAGREVNLGTAVRFDAAARLENARAGAKPNLAVFQAAAQSLPFALTLLERHPFSTQAFLPLRAARWLICAAPSLADGMPDVAGLRAFITRGDQGVNLRRALWHHPVLALDEDAVLAMLAWEDGSSDDCQQRKLVPPLTVQDPARAP